jgi:hypothetical protein
MIGEAGEGCSVLNRKRRGEASHSGRCVGNRKAAQEGWQRWWYGKYEILVRVTSRILR